jgi:hypothetical protein
MHPITFFPSLSINVAPKCHFPFNFQINFDLGRAYYKEGYFKNKKKIYG